MYRTAKHEPDTVRECESEGRGGFDYGIGILLSDLAVYRLVAHIQRRTDIVKNTLWFIEENELNTVSECRRHEVTVFASNRI